MTIFASFSSLCPSTYDHPASRHARSILSLPVPSVQTAVTPSTDPLGPIPGGWGGASPRYKSTSSHHHGRVLQPRTFTLDGSLDPSLPYSKAPSDGLWPYRGAPWGREGRGGVGHLAILVQTARAPTGSPWAPARRVRARWKALGEHYALMPITFPYGRYSRPQGRVKCPEFRQFLDPPRTPGANLRKVTMDSRGEFDSASIDASNTPKLPEMKNLFKKNRNFTSPFD